MREFSSGIYFEGGRLYTKSISPGNSVYGEKTVSRNGEEYREWNPFRSKLSAAIRNGLEDNIPIKEGSTVLYLGAAEGTTASHVSDIVGEKGVVFAVDVSAKAFRKFLCVCKKRKNIVPILADASKPFEYKEHLRGFKISALFQDVSQKNQVKIFADNAREFSINQGLISVKARSIDSSMPPKEVFKEQRNKLAKEFQVIREVHLRPFEKDHALFHCKKKVIQ